MLKKLFVVVSVYLIMKKKRERERGRYNGLCVNVKRFYKGQKVGKQCHIRKVEVL